MRLVILGGGSVNTPAFFSALSAGDSWLERVCLVDCSAEWAERVGKFCAVVARRRRLRLRVTWETDLARAAAGADVLLNVLRVGGLAALAEDRRRLAAGGAVGHAATYPQAVRNLPATLEAAHTVEQVAGDVLWVNFSNPVSTLCEALALHTNLSVLGICYHAFALRADFARLLGVGAARVRVEYRGLNHLGWVTDVLADDTSQMERLVAIVRGRRIKKHNHWYARLGMIPVDHAFCLYHRGDVWYDRQKGIRGSLEDVALRLGRPSGSIAAEARQREKLRQLLLAGRVDALGEFAAQAPWYATCIVPFLAALSSGHRQEFIITWKHAGQDRALPEATAESDVQLEEGRVLPVTRSYSLPAFATEWLRQARCSERLLIRAILERSADLATQAWAVHPNVASWKHAERLASLYFRPQE